MPFSNMLFRSLATAWLTGVSLVAIADRGVVHALTVFSDRTIWNQAVSSFTVTTETFDAADTRLLQDGDVVTLPTGINLEAQAAKLFAAGSITSGFDAFADGNIVLSDFDPEDTLTFSFPQPVVAIGFDYLDIDLGGVQIAGLFSSENIADVLEVPKGSDASAPTADFFGILADTPLTAFTLQLMSNDVSDISSETWDLDNLSFATHKPAVAVAEPSGVVALGLLAVNSLSRQLLKRVREPK
jgi:hypothetical protein